MSIGNNRLWLRHARIRAHSRKTGLERLTDRAFGLKLVYLDYLRSLYKSHLTNYERYRKLM